MLRNMPRNKLKDLNPPYPDYDYFHEYAAHPFRPEAAGFNVANAWFTAECCMLAYAGGALCLAAFAKKELSAQNWRPQVLAAGPAYALFAASDVATVVAFRGTQVDKARNFFNDAETDAKALPDWHDPAKAVHSGFHERLEKIWPQVKLLLDAERRNGGGSKPLWITGHSMGGGIAVLAADRAHQDGFTVDGLSTFGCPRTGNERFVRDLEANMEGRAMFQIVNATDSVARLPPHLPITPYVHTSKLHWLDSSGQFQKPPPDLIDEPNMTDTSASRVWKWALGFAGSLSTGLIDHAPINYGTRLFNRLSL